MLSPETIYGTAGGFLTGFAASAAMVRVLISKALAEFKNQLGTGEDGFITRREVHILLHRPRPEKEQAL